MPDQPSKFLIQIERLDEKPGIQEVRALLEPLGVVLDTSYGPICVNPRLGRYVVRGEATKEAKGRAEKLPGVSFFPDAKVSPARG